VVLTPIQHDSPANWPALRRQGLEAGECEPIPGKTMPPCHRGRARLSQLYKRFTALGPLMDKLGNGGKGIAWNTEARSRTPQKS
jgi:nitrate reductase alpha subunit